MIQKFEFKETEIKGLIEVTPFNADDIRGCFTKDYSKEVFEANGIKHDLAEVFYTTSYKGVIRALHFQREKQQPKLVRCIHGHVYDVVVDLRKDSPTFKKWLAFELIGEKHNEILVPAGMGDVAIFTELGRYMLAPNGALVAKAIREKHIYKEYIGLDACAANLMRPAIYGAYHHITVMGKENQPCDHKYDITGGLCENCDKFAVDRMLPKIDIGDIIYIHDTGAHGFSMGYNYNGKLRSAEVLLKEDGSFKLIRRAETPKDYFATFDFSDKYSFSK